MGLVKSLLFKINNYKWVRLGLRDREKGGVPLEQESRKVGKVSRRARENYSRFNNSF